jgi:hypothetical protein
VSSQDFSYRIWFRLGHGKHPYRWRYELCPDGVQALQVKIWSVDSIRFDVEESFSVGLPSGKHTKNYGKSQFLRGINVGKVYVELKN